MLIRIVIVAALCSVLISCGSKNTATIEGQFHGSSPQTILLEKLSPTGSHIVDSTKTNSSGEFDFSIKFEDIATPSFYNIRMGEEFVPLLVAAGEHVEITSVGNIYNNYTVAGSQGSELIRQLNREILLTSQTLDSIFRLHQSSVDTEQIQKLGREYGQKYIQLKRTILGTMLRNTNSLAVIVPLYQPMLHNEKFLFDDPSDIIYYRIIADSLEKYYPNSPYIRSLRNDIKQVDNAFVMDSLFSVGLSNTVDFPDISMPDALGRIQQLSSLKGKVILLDFTATDRTELNVRTRELVDVYNKYASQGFEIYQVALDLSKPAWLDYIAANKLPWIQVCDFNGAQSSAVTSYNIRTIPSNFLITPGGDFAAQNLTPAQLDKELAKLLK